MGPSIREALAGPYLPNVRQLVLEATAEREEAEGWSPSPPFGAMNRKQLQRAYVVIGAADVEKAQESMCVLGAEEVTFLSYDATWVGETGAAIFIDFECDPRNSDIFLFRLIPSPPISGFDVRHDNISLFQLITFSPISSVHLRAPTFIPTTQHEFFGL